MDKVVEWLSAERDFDPKTSTMKSYPRLPNVRPSALADGILELFRYVCVLPPIHHTHSLVRYNNT